MTELSGDKMINVILDAPYLPAIISVSEVEIQVTPAPNDLSIELFT